MGHRAGAFPRRDAGSAPQAAGWPGHAGRTQSAVSGEEATLRDAGASLPYSDAASHAAKAARVAELRSLFINSFYDAH